MAKRETWEARETRIRNSFAHWAAYRLQVYGETPDAQRRADGRFRRINELLQAAGTAEALSIAWSSSLDPSSSIAKSTFLTKILQSGENIDNYLERVCELMNSEVDLLPFIRDQYHRSYVGRTRDLLLRRYERYLPFFGIPEHLEMMVEVALYSLYVAETPKNRIVIPDNRIELLRAIKVDESALRVVTPRRFEEVVAFLYEKLGCRVFLTPEGGDNGGDVLVWQPGPFGSEALIAVQVKLHKKSNPVRLHHVHALHGAVTHYNAKQAQLVTTARLTRSAEEFMTEVKYLTIDTDKFREEIAKILG